MSLLPNGVEIDGTEITCLAADERHGLWLLLRGQREEIEVRVTKGGRLRVSEVRKRKAERVEVP